MFTLALANESLGSRSLRIRNTVLADHKDTTITIILIEDDACAVATLERAAFMLDPSACGNSGVEKPLLKNSVSDVDFSAELLCCLGRVFHCVT